MAQFGVWAVTGAFATYAGLMDLGITRGLGRFIAFYHASGNRRAVEQLFALGLIAVACVGVVAGTAAYFAAPTVAGALDDVLTAERDAHRAALLGGDLAFSTRRRSVMRAVPEGMEQFVPPNVAEVGFNTVNFVFSVAALVALARPRDLRARQRRRGRRRPRPSGSSPCATCSAGCARASPPRPLVKETLAFSVQNQVAWIADLSAGQAAKIIVALLIDVRAAGAYEIASRAVLAAKSVAVLSVSAMVPTATARIVNEGAGIIADFYRRYTVRSLVGVVSAAGLPLRERAGPAGRVARRHPDDTLELFIVLTLANCVNLSTGVAYALVARRGSRRA